MADNLTSELLAWRKGGSYTQADGVDLFYRVSGDEDQPWLVCFHGFPTSSWDWHLLLPRLEQRHRVLVFDFPGYGLSGKPPDRDYALGRQLDAALSLMAQLGISGFDLLTHDMGNSVACEFLRRREQNETGFELRSLTLLNGGIYMELHKALLTQKLLRTPLLGALTAKLTSWRLFRLQYPNVYARPEQFSESHYQSQWALLMHNQGRRTLHRIAGYMKERTRMGEAWTGPLHRLDTPFRVIWGREDPIAVYDIALRLCEENPRAELVTLEGIGHYPQLESPASIRLAGEAV